MIANQTKIEYIKPSKIEQCIEKEGIEKNGDYNAFQQEYLTKHNIKDKEITEEIQNKVILEYLLQNVLKTNGIITKEDVSKYRIIASNILEKFKYNEALIELVTNHKEISSKISSIYNNSWNCIWLLILNVIVAIIWIIDIISEILENPNEYTENIFAGSIFILIILLPIIILIFFSNKEIYIENKLDNIKYSINLYNNFKFSFINHILIPFIYLCLVVFIVVYIIGVIKKKIFKIHLHDNKIFGQKIKDLICKIKLTYLIISFITIIYIFIKRYQYKQYRTKNIDAITINKDGVYIHDVKYELIQ